MDPGLQQTSNRRQFSPDEVYFNDMDIGAWERRTSAVTGLYELGYDLQEEDELYYDDAGEAVSQAEYEEILFRRVLDKIRVARASGDSDVQLNEEELEAYRSRLHGPKTPPGRLQPRTRLDDSPVLDDAASMLSAHTTGRPDHAKTKSKKSQQRTSLFSSKPKKEKPSSRKRAVSSVSSGSSQVPPGFVVPGPDGHSVYHPINAYPGNPARDPRAHSRPSSRSASGNSQAPQASSRTTPSQDWHHEVPGAFPGAFPNPIQAQWPGTPPQQQRPTPSRQPTWSDSDSRNQARPVPPAKLVPVPIEPFKYQSFSPSSSSSQPSPPLPYTRRPSAPASEASYTSMPRRVPVSAQHTIPVAGFQPNHPDIGIPQPPYPGFMAMDSGDFQGVDAYEATPQPVPVQTTRVSGTGKDGERRRKGGKTKKKT
jgi:hypothetical protein